RAFRFDFGVDFWAGVAQNAPTIMSAKFSSKAILKQSVAASKGKVNFVPPVGLAYEFAQISPETANTCWIPSVGPQVALALMKALTGGDGQQGKTGADEIGLANETQHRNGGLQEGFATYNIQLEKGPMGPSGYCKPGPIRPPYNVMPEDMVKACRE